MSLMVLRLPTMKSEVWPKSYYDTEAVRTIYPSDLSEFGKEVQKLCCITDIACP